MGADERRALWRQQAQERRDDQAYRLAEDGDRRRLRWALQGRAGLAVPGARARREEGRPRVRLFIAGQKAFGAAVLAVALRHGHQVVGVSSPLHGGSTSTTGEP